MKVSSRLLSTTFFLILGIFQSSAIPQICPGCEIAEAVRNTRLATAAQAITNAEAGQDSIIAKQFPFGIPTSPPNADAERRLIHKEWIALYDKDLRLPIWVAYQLTKAQSASTVGKRQDCFRSDPRLADAAASKCEDYEEPLFDRGHMLPSNDSKRRQSMMDNGFLFSNMAPQFENFNRKVWQRLETAVHNWAITSNGLYVVTGAVFDRNNDGKRDPDSDAVRMAPLNRCGAIAFL
jgi:endonuclease G